MSASKLQAKKAVFLLPKFCGAWYVVRELRLVALVFFRVYDNLPSISCTYTQKTLHCTKYIYLCPIVWLVGNCFHECQILRYIDELYLLYKHKCSSAKYIAGLLWPNQILPFGQQMWNILSIQLLLCIWINRVEIYTWCKYLGDITPMWICYLLH